jgi:hypothetical protein
MRGSLFALPPSQPDLRFGSASVRGDIPCRAPPLRQPSAPHPPVDREETCPAKFRPKQCSLCQSTRNPPSTPTP